MKRAWFAPTMSIGLLVIYSVLYIWQPGGGDVLLLLTHIFFSLFALLASVLALRASWMFEPGVTSRRVWLFFGAGMTVMTVSELLWILYYVEHLQVQYPSVIEISWGMGFVSVMASLVMQYRSLGAQISRRHKLLVLATYIGVLITISVLSLGSILSNPGQVAVMQLLIGAYYLVGNLGVAFIAALSLLFLGKGLVGRPWRYMVASILLFAVGGLAFSYGTWNNTYMTGSNLLSGLTDLAYRAAYVMAAAGGYSQITLRLPVLN